MPDLGIVSAHLNAASCEPPQPPFKVTSLFEKQSEVAIVKERDKGIPICQLTSLMATTDGLGQAKVMCQEFQPELLHGSRDSAASNAHEQEARSEAE